MSYGAGNRPRPGVHLRIVDLNFVLEHVRAGACETLDKCQAVTGAAVRVEDRPRLKRAHPMIEIRGLHNGRIAFPVTSGSAIPLADARCDRRAVVGGLLGGVPMIRCLRDRHALGEFLEPILDDDQTGEGVVSSSLAPSATR